MRNNMKLGRCIAGIAFFCLLPSTVFAQLRDNSVRGSFARAGLSVLKSKQPSLDFTLSDLNGNPVSLKSLRGKVVFLNFWATWCPPCRSEMPSMEILYRSYKDKGLEFLTVDVGEDREDVAAFIKEFKLSFPVVLDSSGRVSARYGVRGIPATFIIDRDGDIVAYATGSRDWSISEMFAAFDLLLNTR